MVDSFSDVELLCDLLEASKKRNVSVHLLLDQLNLNLFVSMWQDLKLDSKNFPVSPLVILFLTTFKLQHSSEEIKSKNVKYPYTCFISCSFFYLVTMQP